MNRNPIEIQQLELHFPPELGQSRSLVFDDDPLDGLLDGVDPSPPTPASVLELWERGHDRSEPCARAVSAVLVQCPDAIRTFRDLDAAEDCLRSVLESNAERDVTVVVARWASLGRILELKNRKNEAETCYRKALQLHADVPTGSRRAAITPIVLRLIELLEISDRQEEAKQLRNRFAADSMRDREDVASLKQLRLIALEMFLAGQFADAEAVYVTLVEKRFELPSTSCHLARVYLMTNREQEARREVEKAWTAQTTTLPSYLRVRIHFLRTLLQMLAEREWKTCLEEFKNAISERGAHHDWKMQPVLDHLRPRLGQEKFDLLTAMLEAACQRSRLTELDNNALWTGTLGINETLPSHGESNVTAQAQ